MNRMFFFLLLTFLSFSCTDIDYSSRKEFGAGHGQVPEPDEEEPEKIPVFYTAGLEYRQGYDWRRDPEYGVVDCSMFLLEDGRRVLDFNVGYDSQVSSDADMVRCSGGHVYTDFSTDSETVVKEDGIEIFRFPGREMIVGFLVREDGVYTTGVPREGTGWTYRRNGIVLLGSDTGELRGGLYEDLGQTVFAYEKNGYGYYGSKTASFIVRNGVTSAVETPSQDMKILDYMMADGELHLLVEYDGQPYILNGNRKYGLDIPEDVSATVTGLLSDGASVYVTGCFYGDGGFEADALWKGSGLVMVFREDVGIDAVYPLEDGIYAVGHYRDCMSSPVIYLDGEYVDLPDGYVFPGTGCAAFAGRHHCICFNPETPGCPPLMVLDGKLMEFDMNGCFSAVCQTWMESSQDTVLDKS